MNNIHMAIHDAHAEIGRAAQSANRVAGLTHRHYKYPARFSPEFVATVIESLSKPGDLILDPYMGGGTTIVEAMVRDRVVVGCDLNSLAVFVTKAKTTVLTRGDVRQLRRWACEIVPSLKYNDTKNDISEVMCEVRTRNLHVPRARAIKKFIALAILSQDVLVSERARIFARCALLNVSQWALNGRKAKASLAEFRARLNLRRQRSVMARMGAEPVQVQIIGSGHFLISGWSDDINHDIYQTMGRFHANRQTVQEWPQPGCASAD